MRRELRYVDVRKASRRLAQRLRDEGKTWAEIAVEIRHTYAVSARAAMRIAHQWTQQQVADQWNARWPDHPKEKKNFSYWENWPQGGRSPSLDDLGRLAQLYRCSLADLLTDIDFSDPALTLSVQTRSRDPIPDPEDAPGIGEVSSAFDPVRWESASSDKHAGAVEPDGQLEHRAASALLQAARERYEHVYRQVGGVATSSRINAFFNAHAAPLLSGHYGIDVVRSVGRLAALAGICAFDADSQWLAQHYFQRTLRLANDTDDSQLAAYVSVLLANEMFLDGNYSQAIAIADSQLGVVSNHLTPALRTDLYLTKAKSHACTGARTDAYRAMTLAAQTAARIRQEEEPPEAGYIGPGLVELQMAEALTHLSDLSPAQECAEHAVRAPTHPRGCVQRLATLAKVDLRRGEIDRAAASTLQMVDAAVGMESHQLRRRFQQVRDHLAMADSPVASEAAQRVSDWLAAPL